MSEHEKDLSGIPGADVPGGPPGGPTGSDIESQDYRHSIDIRFLFPYWLGNHYIDLRIGRNRRTIQRAHVIPRRVRNMNRVAVGVFGQMVIAWLVLLGVAFYWSTQTACGTAGGMLSLPTSGTASTDDRFILGAPEYVPISEEDQTKVDSASALVRELAPPDIRGKLDTVDLYFADTLYIALDHGQSYDGVALPLGSRIVLWCDYVESADVVSLAALYTHELKHMLQTPDFVGTTAAESEAMVVQQSFLGDFSAFTGTDAFTRWATDQAMPAPDIAAARSLSMARSADGTIEVQSPFECGHASLESEVSAE